MKINSKISKLSSLIWNIKLNKIYIKIKNFLEHRNYDLIKDLNYNENLLKLLKINIQKVKSNLNSFNFQYQDPQLSWHYHLFLGLKDYFGDKKINILEIGTFNGNFSNFLSKVYSESQIITIDLDENDQKFIDTYDRNEKKKLDEFLKLRRKNLNRDNLDFIKLNSLNIKSYFNQKKFDLIWVDGNHLNPQVTIDIINSLDLLANDGIICTDDVIMDEKFEKGKYISNEGFFTLKHLEDNGLIKSYYLIKRITKNNATLKKYVSVSTFKNNSKFIIQ
tara:strand:+ start:387 stop:1217 length:831 start_codon:yes stop_codon:yes gene_type:complete